MSATTGLTVMTGSLLPRPAGSPSNVFRTCTADDRRVMPGDAVYSHGDPAEGLICSGGLPARGKGGEFYGIALAEALPRQSVQVLVRGKLDGFAIKDAFAIGTQFYMGATPEQLSTFENPLRPDPLATIVADETDGTPVLDVHGYVEGE